ncbi:hypothetical protein HanRHA438_Chr01g0024051 [Helianthus annuus]|nr:hypothetical protein HanIR_Chr01g0025401 [Helianthus annuus]KAJ0948158.1 hypothetical protein HanRHA438_Chr01g0024051 [Helianthus annuus]
MGPTFPSYFISSTPSITVHHHLYNQETFSRPQHLTTIHHCIITLSSTVTPHQNHHSSHPRLNPRLRTTITTYMKSCSDLQSPTSTPQPPPPLPSNNNRIHCLQPPPPPSPIIACTHQARRPSLEPITNWPKRAACSCGGGWL